MEYRHLMKSPAHKPQWTRSFSNELRRLAQGVGRRIKGTNTIYFTAYDQIPAERLHNITYSRIVCTYCPQKAEPERTCLTIGGNLIEYPGNVSAPTADSTTAKMVINRTIFTPGAHMMCGDIANFYLGTLMTSYEYMRISITLIPQELIEESNLMPLLRNSFIYVEIQRSM
jgi:hypothetical protein